MKFIQANNAFQSTSDKIAIQVITDTDATLTYCLMPGLDTWAAWDEKLTAGNTTVVANIPVGLYLKLDQDCYISER